MDSASFGTVKLQFRLSTIFVLTLVATVLAAYLSPLGNDLLLAGLTSAVVSLVVAFAVGSIRPPLVDRVFWGMVVAAMMQAVCADIDKLDRLEIFAWPITAGVAAVFAVGCDNMYRRMVLAGLAAGLCFAGFATNINASTTILALNVICAVIGGALLAVMITLISWLEKRYKLPQPAIGLVMVLSAIGFAIVAPVWIPGW
jgi:hypothetical protein